MTTLTTVITAYDDHTTADRAIAALREEGFEDRQIQILSGDATTLMSALTEHGFKEGDARAYAEAADGGKTLVVASVPEEQADQAVSIMDRVEAEAGASSAGSVPVVEEALSVGKAKTATGGVRVTSSVRETPVEETVTLTEETVAAERHAADRALSAEEAEAAFQGKTIEMMGTKEVVEVRKDARVVGEVELTREAQARQETVRDTLRKTEVEVEHIGGGAAAGAKTKN